MRVLSADVVKPVGNHVVYVFPHAVEKTEFVNNTLWAAFTTCAIVRQQCDHRIVGQIVLIQKVEQATNLSVRVIEHRRKSFLQSARHRRPHRLDEMSRSLRPMALSMFDQHPCS